MNTVFLSITLFFFLLAILFIILFVKKWISYKKIYARFKDVIDIEEEKKKVEHQHRSLESELTDLKNDYKEKRAIYENLLKEISILEEDLDFISYGIYKPHFDFDTSEKYKEKIIQVRHHQKEIVREKVAAVCHQDWEVSGSKAEGRKMTNRNIKLILRAFNNECDSAILKIKWNNVQKMEERIKKAFEALNKLGEPIQIEITEDYLQWKLNELYLAHEYQEKLYEEKEEQRRIREQMREEEKVQREIEQAKKEAEQKEQSYQKSLDQARREIESAHGEELAKLKEQMKLLEEKLKEAQELKERALSRAQLTKSGHVYVISNIGSFGENVYKIGLTRRFIPEDRIRELGDASVPFYFDIHAMIYSEDAPDLETKMHNIFNEKRLNLVNNRKEFFRINLDEIEKAVKDNHGEIEFTKLVEAKEYRESVSIRDQDKIKEQQKAELEAKFPESL